MRDLIVGGAARTRTPDAAVADREPSELTHLDEAGRARMVDVGDKDVDRRGARWRAPSCACRAETAAAVARGDAPKGDVLGTARIAGIQAAKRTAELIPLCHPLPLSFVGRDASRCGDGRGRRSTAEARTTAQTGVEMEAMTAASVAALTVYDMVKGLERGVEIAEVVLLEKSGGAARLEARGVSPETVALIHSVYDAMNRRDLDTLRRLALENPDYVWSNGVDMPEPGLRDGVEGTAYVEEFFRAFDRNHTTVREVIDLGETCAIFMVHHSVRGAVSGAVVERDEVHLWRTQDGRLTSLDEFLTLDEALEAAASA